MATDRAARDRPGVPDTPRILDEKIELTEYDGPIRQLTITDLGHEEPTLLLTNQLRRSPAKLIGTVCPADDHREPDRRRHRLFPHGCPLVGGGHEGELRSATDADGQQPLPPARGPHRQRIRDRPSRATSSGTSSTRRPSSPSTRKTSSSASRNGPTTRCCWPWISRRRTCGSPGWATSICALPSVDTPAWC